MRYVSRLEIDTEPMGDIVLLTKKDRFSHLARETAQAVFQEDAVLCFSGEVGEPFPEGVGSLRPRAVLSFLSPWIVPQSVIDSTSLAINFHPASKDYPGIGCYNFALYEGATTYGAICHFMAAKVDTGDIIDERRFAIFDGDTVETLKLRTMVTMLSMFHDLVSRLAEGAEIQPNGMAWPRRPFTRRELNALTIVSPDMPESEVERRVRATTYPGFPGAVVRVGGRDFYSSVPTRLSPATVLF
ncbi:MAG: formyltransferase family protein [Gemmatimonadales bacterium]|nr:formyltransferase family protein [Gemmatimonadales bacterium]